MSPTTVITTEHKSVPTFTVSKGNTDVLLEGLRLVALIL